MIFDQNLTIILVNASDHKLKKGYGYDLDCMALAICTVLLSVVGCPWLVSATVPSLNHVKSLGYHDGDGKKRDKRRHQGASTDDGDGGEAAAEESQQAGEAGGGSGAAEGEEGVGEGRGAAGADVLSPKMFYGGNFTEDFPNRARVDALYREAEVFVQKREQSSSELEESSGDGQGNNPFEVCATLWCAGPRL